MQTLDTAGQTLHWGESHDFGHKTLTSKVIWGQID